jgi:hypothetical protein
MAIRFVDCSACADYGFVWIPCVGYRLAHWRRKGEADYAVVTQREKFRAPCTCRRGRAWIEARRRGEELDDGD